ncbi:B12-binding domain-containing radical SAM protein [Chloroflexota bacterium]
MKKDALILTGFGPLPISATREMGIDSRVYEVLTSVIGKDNFCSKIPTIGAIAVATFAEKHNLRVQVKDYYNSVIDDCHADIIGISSTFMGPQHSKEVASFAKRNNPTATIVLGGPLSWSIPPSVLFTQVPEIDIIVVGEGEQTFVELVEATSMGADLNKVKGLFLNQGHRCSFTGPREQLARDAIPTPRWELLNTSSSVFPLLPVETSRGCHYNCAYCSEVHYWGKPPRYRGINTVIQEIAHNIAEFGITTFRFADSCFSAPPKRTAALCDAMYERFAKDRITFRWSSYARINNLTPVLLEKMKRSGCFALDIGVDSGDSSILRRMGRNYSRDQVINVAKAARELDIITDFNIVVGFPGETKETVDRTIDLIQEAQPNAFSCFVLFVAPHMTISEHPERYGLSGSGLSWCHTTMNSEQAQESLARISASVTSSCSFPGAEAFAGYLTAVGYSNEQIRTFFKAIGQLARGAKDEAAHAIVEEACVSLRDLW